MRAELVTIWCTVSIIGQTFSRRQRSKRTSMAYSQPRDSHRPPSLIKTKQCRPSYPQPLLILYCCPLSLTHTPCQNSVLYYAVLLSASLHLFTAPNRTVLRRTVLYCNIFNNLEQRYAENVHNPHQPFKTAWHHFVEI